MALGPVLATVLVGGLRILLERAAHPLQEDQDRAVTAPCVVWPERRLAQAAVLFRLSLVFRL